MHAMTLSPKGYCGVRTMFTGGEEELVVTGDGSTLAVSGERTVRTGRARVGLVDGVARVMTDGGGKELVAAVGGIS